LNKLLERIGWLLVALVTVAFSLKNIIEPDVWWQLAAGDWMLKTHSVLTKDVLSFTFAGSIWINIKWGYELLIAMFVRLFSPELLPLIQALVSCMLVYILIKTSRLFLDKENRNSETVAILIGIILFLISSEYRMNTRPEMFSHLFTAAFIYILTKYSITESKQIYWLIPIQLFWANLHDGYVVGLVLTLMFMLVYWFRYMNGNKHLKPIQLSRVFLLLLIATCINPFGYHLLFKGFNIFNQIKETKYTTEFLDYSSYLFWTKESYISVCVFGLVFLVYTFRLFRSTSPELNWKYVVEVVQYEMILPILFIGAFMVLALMAYRNVIFLAIVCIPHFINIIVYLINKFKTTIIPKLQALMIGLYIVLFVGIVSQKYYEYTKSHNRFGLEVASINHPLATAQYLQSKGLEEGVFSDYLNSSFLMYYMQPIFKSYIDLRDYEIFTPDFFNDYATAVSSGENFMKIDSAYHFKAIALLTKQNSTLHQFLYNDSTFHLTHLDGVCAVYERGGNKSVIPYTKSNAFPQSALSNTINKVMNPLYKNYNEDEAIEWQRAAEYFLNVGDVNQAHFYIDKISMDANHQDIACELRGTYYLNLFKSDTSVASLGFLDSASNQFMASVKLNPKRSASYFGLGLINYNKQQYKSAIKYWESSLTNGDNNLQIHLYVADCFEKLAADGNTKANYQAEVEHLLEANRLNPNNPFIETDLGFTYARLRQCDKAIPYLLKIQNFEGLSKEDQDLAKQFLRDCQN